MLIIQLLGIGCTKCKQMEHQLQKAIEALKINASIELIDDIETFIKLGITHVPSLRINGEIKTYDETLSDEKLITILKNHV